MMEEGEKLEYPEKTPQRPTLQRGITYNVRRRDLNPGPLTAMVTSK